MNANITVLKDESLGGVEREYREVKRKADAGERVKIVDEDSGYAIGTLFTVEDADFAWCGRGKGRDGTGVEVDGGRPLFHERYLTLEPSDIIRINSARYRMVDRKATVGERVIVVSMNGPNSSNGYYYKTGDVAKVKRIKDRGVLADLTENADYYAGGQWNIDSVDYRVLEPVESAESAQQPEPLSAKPAPDQAAEIIVALTTRVTALEKRVAALETAEVTDEDVAEISRIALDPPVFSGTAKLTRAKSPQEIRDDIVKRAKEDVEKLIDEDGFAHRRGYRFPTLVIEEFVVNSAKRTVVVLGIEAYGNRKKHVLGIAKCAPGDVFNSHIGRAIALRRALGLEIPEEYVSAPQPTGVRVGDVVITSLVGIPFVITFEDSARIVTRQLSLRDARVIDDSRESDSAEPRKEVA